MFPSFALFGKNIPSYAVLVLCGIFAAGITACRKAKKAGYDDTNIIVMLLIAGAGAFLGSHLLYGLIQFRLFPALVFTTENTSLFLRRLGIIFGGSVFYGGLLGGIAAGAAYGKKQFREKLPGVCDMVSPVIPLFHFFGRIGCFSAGCCFGVENRRGFTFTRAIIPEANHVSRLPVQLIEAGFNIGLFLLLFFLEKKVTEEKPRGISAGLRGKLLFLYLLIYSGFRFILEFFRGDGYRGFWGPFSSSQWISLFLTAAAVFALAKRKQRSSPSFTIPFFPVIL
jgi:phosphatidylglycerol:prolipoprotein diacylglycerol transferase